MIIAGGRICSSWGKIFFVWVSKEGSLSEVPFYGV